MNKKRLKPVHGIITIILVALVLFVISPLVFGRLGLVGTFLGELSILLVAVLVTAAFHGDFKTVFPVHKPKGFTILGMLLMWGATFASVMAVTIIFSYFWPSQVAEAGSGLSEAVLSAPVLLGVVIVSISPAVCEEAVFRGVFLNSLRGLKSRWLIIVIVGCVFGAFHGSVWKFVPTAALGMLMTYLVLETDNMIYSCLLHMINNLLPIALLYGMRGVYDSMGGISNAASNMTQIPLASVAVYILFAAGAPFVMYIGRYFVRRGAHGYEGEIFHKGNRKVLVALIILTVLIVMVGLGLFMASLSVDQQFFQQIYRESQPVIPGNSL